jgi:hypothetical protein
MESPCGVKRPDVVILSDDFRGTEPKSCFHAIPQKEILNGKDFFRPSEGAAAFRLLKRRKTPQRL